MSDRNCCHSKASRDGNPPCLVSLSYAFAEDEISFFAEALFVQFLSVMGWNSGRSCSFSGIDSWLFGSHGDTQLQISAKEHATRLLHDTRVNKHDYTQRKKEPSHRYCSRAPWALSPVFASSETEMQFPAFWVGMPTKRCLHNCHHPSCTSAILLTSMDRSPFGMADATADSGVGFLAYLDTDSSWQTDTERKKNMVDGNAPGWFSFAKDCSRSSTRGYMTGSSSLSSFVNISR